MTHFKILFQYALVKKGDGATYVNSEGKTMKLPQRFGEVGAVDSGIYSFTTFVILFIHMIFCVQVWCSITFYVF